MSKSTSTSTDAGIAVATVSPSGDNVAIAAPSDSKIQNAKDAESDPAFLHSPPDSHDRAKSDASDSELSDLEEEPILSDAPQPAPASEIGDNGENTNDASDDIGEVLPDHWSGTVPVFKPTMHQFKDFKRFMEAVDSYGMKSGIIKIIPPQDWKDSLPKLDDLVKQVKVREPIKQDIMGSNGTYRQVNILHGRSYNLPQWRQLCDQSEHQPPARRGERRANADKPKPKPARTRAAAASQPADSATPKKRGRGRPAKRGGRGKHIKDEPEGDGEDRPMTPVSPKQAAVEAEEKPMETIEKDPGVDVDQEDWEPTVGRMGGSRQAKAKTQTTSARRKYSRREGSAMIDEAAFKDWDYKMDVSEYTPERCEELERSYWKTLTYAAPLYGADLMGTLFDESTDIWNLNKLPNLLDVLGTKVPGVNTAYLYLGMWKATFAWHLEDVDLYSINYLHFGAPKQWYSISQADARRFEAAMKNIWPADAKACDQFLRHKGFLISPQYLKSHYNITVNKCVSYPGEFVVTYPYGYHSGYNLGYNCAEAVNFALDSWLDIGKIAKKCECAQAQDSVWVNVYEIERKLRGEETEYEETEDEEDDEDDDEQSGLPTPPSSSGVKFKEAGRKRKREPGEKGGKVKVKKIKLRLKSKAEPPCCLCPNDNPTVELLPTDDGRKAHRMCALYLPETYIDTVDDQEVIANVTAIHKDRLDLKCLYCRSKRGACFQCSQKKCARAYHPTCAAAAGVFTEEQEIPVFGEDGTEYKEQAFQFSCRFHRAKRDKKLDGEALEADSRIQTAAAGLLKGGTCQLQYHKGEIFAGVVVENRKDEQTLLVDILPNGYATATPHTTNFSKPKLTVRSDRVEVEWKWLLLADPSEYRLPKASANAIPMPASRKAQEKLNTKRLSDGKPQKDDPFVEGCTWAEFQLQEVSNKDQVKVDFLKPDQVWHYLGKTSTEARAQYTEDPAKQRHNPRGNFMETIPKPPRPVPSASTPRYKFQNPTAYGGSYSTLGPVPNPVSARPDRPYVYKPRIPAQTSSNGPGNYTTQRFTPAGPSPAPTQHARPMYHHYSYTQSPGSQGAAAYSAQRFEVKTPQNYSPGANASGVPHPANPVAQRHHTQWPNTAAPPRPMPTPRTFQHAPAPVTQQQAVAAQPRPQVKGQWQVYSSIYQKYPFFQVHHNRDSAKYRTPYAAWGGFTNGYEGNLRAHIMANKDAFLRGPGMDKTLPSTHNSGSHIPGHHSSPYGRTPTGSSQGPVTQQASPCAQNPFTQPSMQKLTAPSAAAPPILERLPRPAIKAQYLPAQMSQPPNQSSKPKTAPATKPYKIPPKESPVPLPANFLAAMTSTPTTPAAASSRPSVLAAEVKGSPAESKSTVGSLQVAPKSPEEAVTEKQLPGARISQTPVPIPHQPGISPPAARQQHNFTTKTTAGILEQAIKAENPQPQVSVTTLDALRGQSAARVTQEQGCDLSQLSQSTARHSNTTMQPEQAAHDASTEPAKQPPMGAAYNNATYEPQGFPDVPGCESMEFVERLMKNLRKVSQRGDA
ncbi:hypothetical protein FZEAL_5945 [Fusarium zealandicum]|uniref:[histone H3]-trimethyl-L-lysine(9) demethylase n=1 Tax=Fusarium zealandicum TaxID=1053134 RepID=A0A8H4UIV4_9HYPO|nr:hypothetical protein FZEAL_5945 [Fusarium zealandicum]